MIHNLSICQNLYSTGKLYNRSIFTNDLRCFVFFHPQCAITYFIQVLWFPKGIKILLKKKKIVYIEERAQNNSSI